MFGTDKRVLVVDDSLMTRNQIREILEKDGHRVVEAANGADALSFLRDEAFDVGIIDINMPVMSGMELIRELRQLPEHSEMHIFVLSTEGGAALVREGRTLGVHAWLPKPVNEVTLRGGVRLAPVRVRKQAHG